MEAGRRLWYLCTFATEYCVAEGGGSAPTHSLLPADDTCSGLRAEGTCGCVDGVGVLAA